MQEKKYLLTSKQSVAYDYLTSQEDCGVMYGGAKGGGKTYLFCVWVFNWCLHLIEFFGIEETKHPIPVGFMGRKRSVDFDKTTFETWKQVIPSPAYVIHDQSKEVVIQNKVKIFFGGLDDQNLINKFNSAEYAFFAIDQGEETERGEVAVLQGSLRLRYNGKTPPYKQLYTANPAECWLKEDYITNPKPRNHYVRALYSDNPYLPVNYAETLENAFGFDPILLAAYKEGDWEALQPRQALITQTALSVLPKQPQDNFVKRHIVACDPSLGGDECVLYYMVDYEIKDQLFLHSNDTQQLGNDTCIFMTKHKCEDLVIDAIGIGKGVADYVKAAGKKVLEVISSASARDDVHFSNLRSEIWGYLSLRIRQKSIPYPIDEKLRQQLCAVKYKTNSKKFELESKDLTKKSLGCSPDRADTFAYGIWGSAQVITVTQMQRTTPEYALHDYNPIGGALPKSEFANSDYNPLR